MRATGAIILILVAIAVGALAEDPVTGTIVRCQVAFSFSVFLFGIWILVKVKK